MQHNKRSAFVITTLMMWCFDLPVLAHDTGVVHQHGEVLATLTFVVAVLGAGRYLLKFE